MIHFTQHQHRKRCKRWDLPGDAHALTFSCYKNRPFLTDKGTCEKLAEAVASACDRYDVALWAYVFMPDHVHLLVWPRRAEYSISSFLLAVKQPVSRYVLRFCRQNQPQKLESMATGQKRRPYRFWQAGGGYDRNIVERDTAWHEIEYINLNPLRRELVEHAAYWYYSSYKDWNTDESGPIEVDKYSFYNGHSRPSGA